MRCVTCGEANPKNLDPCPACGAGAAGTRGPRTAAELESAFAAGDDGPAAAPAGPLRVGQDFGPRYTILKLLGSGGMGIVYQALDRDLNVPVALKVLRPTDGTPRATADLHRRFKTELILARKVTHKHVIRIHDIGEVDGVKFLTMPYVHGQDLATILKGGPLPVVRALRYARQLAAGLAAAHAAGVIHRDLKPANIMVDDGDNALLMDFGIARSNAPGLPQRTIAGAVVGTAAYMAPEQARGEKVDERADIYAFGLILHEMLSGPRFMPKGAVADLFERLTAPPPSARSANAAVPEALDLVVTRCVQPQPGERYQSALELAAALAALSRRGRGPVPGLPPRTRRWWTAAAAALLVGLLLGGAGYWHFGSALSASSRVRVVTREVAVPAKPDAAAVADAARTLEAFDETSEAAARPPIDITPPARQRRLAEARAQLVPAVAAARASRDAGRDAYLRMATLSPEAASMAATGLADLEVMRSHYAAAAEMLERAIEMDRRARNLAAIAPKYLALAEARIGEGRPEDAQVIATELRAGDAASRSYAEVVDASLALNRGDEAAAIASLENLVKTTDLWLARLILGNAYFQAERYADAMREFDNCRLHRAEAAAMFGELPTLRYDAMLDYWLERSRNVATTGR